MYTSNDPSGRPVTAITAVRTSPRQVMAKARKQSTKMLQRIARAVDRGDLETAKYLQRTWLKSRSAKRAGVHQSERQMRRVGKAYLEGQAAIDLGDGISVVRAPGDAVRVFPVRKKRPGDFRIIHEFGQADRARQWMAREAMRPFITVAPFQHGTSNGGGHEVVGRVERLLNSPEYKWAVTADIRNFYRSVDRPWLKANLPVGSEITSSTLLVDDDDLYSRFQCTGWGLHSPCMSAISLLAESRTGLTQGANSSPLIADFVVGKVLEHIRFTPGVVVENIHDNFVIIGRSKADVERALVDLRDAFERHPAGTFRITDDGVRRLCDGIEFLGYRMKRRRGALPVTPTAANIEKFESRLARHVHRALSDPSELRALKAYLRSWRSGFRHFSSRHFYAYCALLEYARAFPMIGRALLQCMPDYTNEVRRSVAEAISH